MFVRIYSGTMKAQSAVHNVNRNTTYVNWAAKKHANGLEEEVPPIALLSEGNTVLTVHSLTPAGRG